MYFCQALTVIPIRINLAHQWLALNLKGQESSLSTEPLMMANQRYIQLLKIRHQCNDNLPENEVRAERVVGEPHVRDLLAHRLTSTELADRLPRRDPVSRERQRPQCWWKSNRIREILVGKVVFIQLEGFQIRERVQHSDKHVPIIEFVFVEHERLEPGHFSPSEKEPGGKVSPQDRKCN